MALIWDLLKKVKKTEPARLNNAFVIIKEGKCGFEYTLTNLGIKEYFNSLHDKVDYKIISIKESSTFFYVAVKISKKDSNMFSFGWAKYEKSSTVNNNKIFSKALEQAFMDAMGKLLTYEEERMMIKKYISLGRAIRIPLQSDKIKIFRKKQPYSFVNQAG